jgi:general secretion pathway protein B
MSFILDALRKSEHERQRQTGPALVEVPVAAPKPKANRWASAAIALLVINLVAIGVLLLVKSRDESATRVVADEAPAVVPAPIPSAAGPASSAAAPAPSAQASVTQALPQPPVSAPPPMLRPALPPPPAAGTRSSLEQETSSYVPPMDPAAAAAAAAPPPGPAAVAPARRGSVVYQSLPEAGLTSGDAPPQTPAATDLPRADDMTARGNLPEMRLELHVWSTKPQERFVFVNGRRYREGDSTADGATVEEITREGVIMNSGGNRFLLSRD